jgi:hypothetical protein
VEEEDNKKFMAVVIEKELLEVIHSFQNGKSLGPILPGLLKSGGT